MKIHPAGKEVQERNGMRAEQQREREERAGVSSSSQHKKEKAKDIRKKKNDKRRFRTCPDSCFSLS